MLVFACISPHPPIILPDVGSPEDRKRVEKTIMALESLAPKLAATKPEIIVISSPHPNWGIEVPLYFLSRCVEAVPLPMWNSIGTSGKFKIKNYQTANNLTEEQWNTEIIYPILTTLDSPKQHFEWGRKIAKNLPSEKRIGWIASGDMSHVLKTDGPYGFNPAGPKYDQKFIELLKKKDIKGILNLDPQFLEEAGECGLRSFCMLLGALEQLKMSWRPEVLSYEGPFGVGYLVAKLYG